MDLYFQQDYKEALRAAMAHRRGQFGARFTFERMATACGVQKTYLSKVLNGAGQLNPDQLFLAGDFLKLNTKEIDFLLLLREMQVSTSPKRAGMLKEKIQKLRKTHLKTEESIDVGGDTLSNDLLWEYYTDIDLQLVHLFMTVSSFSRVPANICECIGIEKSRLDTILLQLQNWNLLEFKNGVYKAKDPKIHLPEDSPVFLAFGILKRIKTIERLRKVKKGESEDYFFSALFSAEAKVQQELKRKILGLLKELQAGVSDSKAEEVFQLNIDFFRWS